MAALEFPDAPVNGQPFDWFVYDGARQVWNLEARQKYIPFEYLVVGGGSYGGYDRGGGGGAGGVRQGETTLPLGGFQVTIGAGSVLYGPYSPTTFSTIEGAGGGNGAAGPGYVLSYPGGSGGGGSGYSGYTTPKAGNFPAVVPSQGNSGGFGYAGGAGGGGGGAGGVGGNGTSSVGGAKGAGIVSSITGSAVTYAEGGGGASSSAQGIGGGVTSGMNGGANTGGGGGANNTLTAGGNGGSGIVILKYPDYITLTPGAGLTASTITSGSFKITSFTAGSDNVTVSA